MFLCLSLLLLMQYTSVLLIIIPFDSVILNIEREEKEKSLTFEFCFLTGRNVHYINWTNNMDQFLALLPFLSFKGHSLNHTAAEGLAEALGVC